MDSFLGHLQINIDPKQIIFYKEFFSFLNWKFIYEDEHAIGVLDKHGSSVWFIPAMNEVKNDYDGVGMNHLAIGVSSPAEVDQAAAWLEEHNMPALFETPPSTPGFCRFGG